MPLPRADLTVLTATIPGREHLLAEALKSVYAQTLEVECHLVMAQSCSEGLQPTLHVGLQQNLLLRAVETEWVMRLADDDQLLPIHVGTLMAEAVDADVIYSYDASKNRPWLDCNEWGQEKIALEIEDYNWIDGSAVLIRTELLKQVGGYPTDWVGNNEDYREGHFEGMKANCDDWGAWVRLARIGARFKCIPEPTWRYGSGEWTRISNE